MSKSSKGPRTTSAAGGAAAAAAVQVAPVKASAQVMRATAQVAKAQVKPVSGGANSKSAVAKVAPAVVSVATDGAKRVAASPGDIPKVTASKRAVLPKRRKRSEEEAKARHRAVERRRVEKINTCIMSIRDEMERLGAVMRKDKASVLNAVHSFLRQYNDKRESVGVRVANQAGSDAVNPTKKRDVNGAQARQQSVVMAAGPVAAGRPDTAAGTAGHHSQSFAPGGFQGVQSGQQQAWQPVAGAEAATSTQQPTQLPATRSAQQRAVSSQGSAEKLASLSHLHTRQTRPSRATRATRTAK